ncbi:MAG: glycoside hydrolase family 18 protein [Thermomicrobiales bacterium]
MAETNVQATNEATTDPRVQTGRIIGYYAGWTRKSKGFTPLDIPAEKLTHINYAFGLIDENNRAMLMDDEADAGGGDELGGNFLDLQLLKAQHPHLKTLISMGGWTGSGRFSDACATPNRLHDFVASCLELYLTRWPGVFNGIDIDWEYPVCCGLPDNSVRPEDKRNCTLLFAELRRQMDELATTTGQRYLLTAAIPGGQYLPTTCFELKEIAEILDWINVMTYDLSGSRESKITNFNAAFAPSQSDPSPAHTREYHNVVNSLNVFEEAGVPREQLVAGVPFYGRGFAGVPNVNNGLYQSFAEETRDNYGDYRSIKAQYLPTYKRFWHPDAAVPWLYDADSGRMISYDDPESIGNKAAYVRDNGYGGIMIWELSDDDEESSLLTAINSSLRG